MRPYKTFLILLVLLLLLYGPSYFLKGPLKIAQGISIEWPDDLSEYLLCDTGEVTLVSDPVKTSNDINSVSQKHEPVKTASDSGFLSDFSDSAALTNVLHYKIFNDSAQLRIMYYGDSQLEGDRITDRLREKFREVNPGTGPGLLSITPLVAYTRTSHVRSSDNWTKYDYLDYREGNIDHRKLGPLMHISRFTKPGDENTEITEAWFSVEPSRYADNLASVYQEFRLFYGNLNDTLFIDIHTDRGIIRQDTLLPSDQASEYRASTGSTNFIKLVFKGKSSPDFYGLSLESSRGAVIDNIPNRGSAGLEFTLAQKTNLELLYKRISPDILILHYGLNVVLNIKEDYKYYEDAIFLQLNRLKEICPDAVLILVSLTDMAHKQDNNIKSYENISLIRDAQMAAARRAGILFWDAWEAMGGQNSIIKWSREKPALAANDYTHLTYAGGASMADMIFNDLRLSGKQLQNSSQHTPVIPVHIQFDTLDIAGFKNQNIKSQLSKVYGLIKSYDHNKPLLFTGAAFWFFLFITLLFYSILSGKPLIRNTYLFLFSLFFYYKSGGVFFVLLIISTLTDYFTGIIIYSARRRLVKRLFVLLSLLVNLGMLSYFKYTGFFTGIVNDLFNTSFPVIDWMAAISNFYLGTGFDINNIILPVGISFFTFQTISYTMDVYRGKTKPVRNILDFGFYVSFFPQLVAGPIVRASEFIPQLYSRFSLSRREWGHALFLILSGLIKKIIISDLISVNFVDRVFDTPAMYSGLENLIAVYGYGLQIYCDFSGYTDIAIGVALMLGYRLPVNFNSPYKAPDITDFWRRWHISLSRWLKDYLYISMGGNRKGKFRTYINLMITMLLGGLWHGAAWRFVIWGGLHGIGLVLHKFWIRIIPGGRGRSGLKRFISILITFNFVSFAWIFFRAQNTEYAIDMLRQIFTAFSPGNLTGVLTSYSQVLIIIFCGYILHFLPARIKESYRGLFIKMPLVVKLIIVYLLALVLYNVQSADIQPFIYFRF